MVTDTVLCINMYEKVVENDFKNKLKKKIHKNKNSGNKTCYKTMP